MTTQSLSAAQEYVAKNGGTYSKNGKLYVCTAVALDDRSRGEILHEALSKISDKDDDDYSEDIDVQMPDIDMTERVTSIMLNLLGVSNIDEMADLNLVTIHDLADRLSSHRGINTLMQLSYAINDGLDSSQDEPTPERIPLPNEELDAPADDLTELDAAAQVGTWDETETPDDDLTEIKGIGPATSDKLKAIGIHNFQQLADLSPEQCETLNEELNVIGNKAQKWSEFADSLIK